MFHEMIPLLSRINASCGLSVVYYRAEVLFACLRTKPLWEKVSTPNENNLLPRNKLFPFRGICIS